jgi:tetratricopeptide (TPR) repeat protein
MQRVEVFNRIGNRPAQLKDLETLESLAAQLDDSESVAKALMLHAAYHFFVGNYSNAIDYVRQAEDYSTSVANTELALYTQVVRITALLRLGQLDEALQHAREALRRDQLAGNRKEEGRTVNVMGLIALERKESSNAQKYLLEALEIAREIKDPSLEARALSNLALAEGSLNGSYALAREYYEHSYEIAHQIGDRISECHGLGNMGFAAGMQGDFVAARSYHEQALTIAREVGNPYLEIVTLINLSALSSLQNEPQSALQHAHLAAELAQKTSDASWEGWALLYMGHAYSLQNEVVLAQSAYRKSIAIRNKLDQSSLAMEPIAGLVETYLRWDDLESAGREAEKILQYLGGGSALEGTDEPLRVYYACYLYLKKKKDSRSRQVLQAAKNLLEAQASKFNDHAARQRYIENIPWRRAIRDEGWDEGR